MIELEFYFHFSEEAATTAVRDNGIDPDGGTV